MTALMTLNGVRIEYQDIGTSSAGKPALVLLTGWGHDLRYYRRLIPHLAPEFRVVALSWRGHDADRTLVGDYGVHEQTADTIALLDAIGVDVFVPVAHAHGGWVALQLADELGVQRVPRVLIADLIMTTIPSDFAAAVRDLQKPDRWKSARAGLAKSWLSGGVTLPLLKHLLIESRGFGFDTWARSGRVIEDAYNRWGSPMGRMEQLNEPRPIRHVFSHPKTSSYDELHVAFRGRHPWFSHRRLAGRTHFPAHELPREIATEIRAFVNEST
ncbi:2-heptyl-3-hydroxy-4(1H)-quinolone (PQS) dioxygenase (plasmid) [Rhodococcus erythropolis]|uniref:2-heptyl-3-hydroxy-4-quinolone dioxygenase AqdC2 n=1 Tax=Rhodococcus erythropolis TaxID=1833 RepID=AQDC2_RHOER|nr:2-heptyl-3-hydroxy-4-quinolone dioxygenase AqdC2 [Rhodococcus erythropolis]A0A0E4AE82.2 RecName: Full=2-heptyl-3-hydroxy-4-quinolone dioxygenase AqdC2; Short=PQS dioxygenase [Rhodococcus erythropolis]AKE01142.2 2-heptyl-3-hydroxy-4(1H)-quinolone (PQS) dioxygenase [Rhodococcus erythropolis]